MTDHQRGAYTPPTADAPLSFDPRQPVRGARPIPFTLILSILVLGALVAAIFYFYQSGVRKAGEAPQVVGQPAEVIKTPPPADAQPAEPAAGLQVYKEEQGGTINAVPAAPTFAPAPETPQGRPTTPVTVAQAPPVKAQPAQAVPVAAIKPAIPAAPPAAAPKVQTQAAAPPKAATPKAATPKAVVAEKPPAPKIATPPAKTAEATPAPKAASGGAVVQIGAVSSTDLAEKAWKDAVAVAPGLAAGKGKAVEKIEKNGGTLYRTAVTGFASKADAQAFCAKLQAAGKSCFVR